MPTARNTNANAAGRNTITVSIGILACAYQPNIMPVDAHSSPPSTRTTSERVNTPASAQNDNALSGAATNSIIAKAAVTWPNVTSEASISTSSHGMGGAGMPVPLPNTHGVVADCTGCVKLAPVGSNTSEYNDPPENIERNTGQYITAMAAKHTSAITTAALQRYMVRIRRWARSSGLSSTLSCWDWNASRRSWNCLICRLSANKTCRDDAVTFDCLATSLRDFMFPAISAKASHGRHNCTHASYGFLPNIMAMAMPKLRSSLHSQTINQDDMARSVYR